MTSPAPRGNPRVRRATTAAALAVLAAALATVLLHLADDAAPHAPGHRLPTYTRLITGTATTTLSAVRPRTASTPTPPTLAPA